MCGILGKVFINSNNLNKRLFEEALNLMEHRGPDNKGVYYNDKIIFGQRRLSIIDLSEEAKQPMISEDGNIILVFNGEIYNFDEIKSNLVNKGYKFKTKSDTEVLLNSFYDKGIECIKDFIGMFAFAIYDKRNNEIFIVRDRLGIKPLYYFRNNGDLTFSSEIKSILRVEEDHSFNNNEDSISAYMSFRYPILNDTFFKDIYSLPAAHYIRIRNDEIEIERYWDFNDKLLEQQYDMGEDYYIFKLREILESAVKYRMISDVEIGSFLSGGVDSSVITAIMALNQDKPVNTFTIGFDDEGFNEFEYAKIVAEKYNTKHNEINISGNRYVETMDRLISFKDSPLSVPNEVPLYLMSKELKKYITVVLSGEGADEIFGGYGRIFRSPKDYNSFHQLENGDYTIEEKSIFLKKFSEKYSGKIFNNPLDHFYFLYSYTSYKDKTELLQSHINTVNYHQELKNHFESCFAEVSNQSYYNKIMYSFERVHLQGLLNRVDMTTMAASVEARVPFVDHRLVEFAFTIPVKYKLKWKSERDEFLSKLLMSSEISEKHDIPKYILKKAYEPFLPDSILYRKKMGFPVPLNRWFSGDFNEYAKSILLDQQTINRKQINISTVEKWLDNQELLNNHSSAIKIWMLINIELFNRKYFN